MIFTQHQKFLLKYKKYYSSCYFKVSNPKFFGQYFQSSNFIIPINETFINRLAKRERFIRHSLKGVLLVNFPEKEKNFLIKNLAAENKIPLITQSASLLLKDSRNMDDILGVDDPIQILFDKVKTYIPCICFINNLDSIGKQRYEQEQKSLDWLNNSFSLFIDHNQLDQNTFRTFNNKKPFTDLQTETTPLISSAGFDDFHINDSFLQFSFKNWLSVENRLPIFKRKSTINYYRRLPSWLSKTILIFHNKTDIEKAKRFDSYFSIYNKTVINKNKNISIKPKNVYFSGFGYHEKETLFSKAHSNVSLHAKQWESTQKNKLYKALKYDRTNKNESISRFWFQSSHSKLSGINQNWETCFLASRVYDKYKHETRPYLKSILNTDANVKNKHLALLLKKNINGVKTNFSLWPPNLKLGSMNETKQTKRLVSKPFKLYNNVDRFFLAPMFLGLPKQDYVFYSDDQTKDALNSNKLNITFKIRESLIKPKRSKISDLQASTEMKNRKNNSLKLTETDIIKRTALLKFLQILDGFHTTTETKKSIFFPGLKFVTLKKLNLFEIFLTLSKSIKSKSASVFLNKFKNNDISMFKNVLLVPQKQEAPLINERNRMPFRHSICKKKTVPFSFWFIKGPPVFEGLLNTKASACFSKEKQAWSKRPISFNMQSIGAKFKMNNKWSFISKNYKTRLANPKKQKNFLDVCISRIPLKKINSVLNTGVDINQNFESKRLMLNPSKIDKHIRPCGGLNPVFKSLLQTREIPKWETYLKNQSSNKSLNLLCIWPSYIEDILGPFNQNDSGSYILPEYFQLLGHGPKLKKQGITLIASTNNLKTLDAALLRPGRFDTIINFSYSFLSIYKSVKKVKHSPCLIQEYTFSSYKFYTKEKSQISFFDWPSHSFKIFYKNMTANFVSSFYGLDRSKTGIRSLYCLKPVFNDDRSHDRGKQNSDSRITPSLWSFTKYKMYKMMEKYPTIGNTHRLSIKLVPTYRRKETDAIRWNLTKKVNIWPNNLWDNPFFYTKKHNALLKDKERWPFSGSTKAGSGFWTIKDQFYLQVVMVDIPNKFSSVKAFIDVSIFIQLKLWWGLNNGKLLWLSTNQKGLIQKSKTHLLGLEKLKTFKLNTYDFVLILLSKINKIKDLTFIFIGILQMLCFRFFYNISQFSMIFKTKLTNQAKFTSENRINQNYNSVHALTQEVLISKAVILQLSKKLSFPSEGYKQGHRLDSFLEMCFIPSNKAYRLYNYENNNRRSAKNLISIMQVEQNDIFLKSNRRLLFCTGDFDYKAYSKKNSEINLLVPQKKVFGGLLTKLKPWKSAKIDFKNGNRFSTDNQFLNLSRKMLVYPLMDKQAFSATAFQNLKINHVMLNKYNQIYKLRRIKVKQQSFFNLHPFSSLILKRWSEITKSNKLKRYLTISVAKNLLPELNFSLYEPNKSNSLVIQNAYFLKHPYFYPFGNLYEKNSCLHKKLPYTQIYNNLYSATLLTPIDTSLLKKQSLKKTNTDSFFSTYQSCLLIKLSTNSSLDLTCLQTYSTLMNMEKKIDFQSLNNQTMFYKKWIFNHQNVLQIDNQLKKIPQKITGSDQDHSFQTIYKINDFKFLVPKKTNILENNNDVILLKNPKEFFISGSDLRVTPDIWSLTKDKIDETMGKYPNLKKEHNSVKRHESFFQNYKMCRLDVSFFLLTFYTMFFEKIQDKKTTLNTIKIFMPYKSLVFSHFLLSQSECDSLLYN